MFKLQNVRSYSKKNFQKWKRSNFNEITQKYIYVICIIAAENMKRIARLLSDLLPLNK